MKDWVRDIVENTHYRDVETLRLKLDEAIKSHNSELDEQLFTSTN
jgi:low affinity Fe/Cu permease